MRQILLFTLLLGLQQLTNLAFAFNDPNSAKSETAVLRCYVSYADQTEIIDTFPQSSGYETKPIDIGGRFTFKAVMIGQAKKLDHIALYAYFQANPKDLPIHEAIYRGPFKLNNRPTLITPYNHLYAGEVERELKYHCELFKVKQ